MAGLADSATLTTNARTDMPLAENEFSIFFASYLFPFQSQNFVLKTKNTK